MGMVLEHELSASYAAGSLGGTLGRLNDSLRRLSRIKSPGFRETAQGSLSVTLFRSLTGTSGQWAPFWLLEPARVARLNQTQRLMADAWQMRFIALPRFSHFDRTIEHLKESTLGRLGPGRLRTGQATYQVLAQALTNLKLLESLRM